MKLNKVVLLEVNALWLYYKTSNSSKMLILENAKRRTFEK